MIRGEMGFRENLARVQERISSSCRVAGRDPSEVTLVAVSKTYPLEAILEAYEAGQRHFGESRLQEALPKIAGVPDDVIWHFIGPLQSNKARKVAQQFDVVHTLYKESQLIEIEKSGATIDGLVEVNIGKEPQKAGLFLQNLDDFVKSAIQCSSVQFRGLMTIGPALDNPDAMRPYFSALREANERLGGQWLSM